MKRLLALTLLFAALTLQAQDKDAAAKVKTEITQARTYIKSGSNLDKAETAMRTLLANADNRTNINIYLTLVDAVRAQYDAANEKLYLKEKYDTVAFFTTTNTMFRAYESLDSIDATPDDKGHIRPKYRKKNADFLKRYRNNLYNGGLYLVQKGEYEKAFNLMDTYISCVNQPLYADHHYSADDPQCVNAAFWAMFSGYKTSNAEQALKYKDIALKGEDNRLRIYNYLAEIYLAQNDTANYTQALCDGFELDKTNTFFFTRLVDLYGHSGRIDQALTIADGALANDAHNPLFLFAKSDLLLNAGRYAECATYSDQALAADSTITDAYFNAGISYFNQALLIDNEAKADRDIKQQQNDLYRRAQPYMERYRQLAPDQKQKWATPLYTIYFNLNLGPQFEEMIAILKGMQQ